MIYTLRNAKQDVQATIITGAGGGEGQCYDVSGRKTLSVKIYHYPVPPDLESRLEQLLAKPPSTILSRIAWPLDIVESGHGEVVGYLQKHFSSRYLSLTSVCSPLTRPRWATPRFIQSCAHQVAYLIAELHAFGYLFPDLHSEQFLVAKNGTVVLVDAASCQFTHADQLFACTHVRGDYQAPEFLDGRNWADLAASRSQHTDSWSLAVLIFELLMGCHPFDGIYIGSGNALPRSERIKQGLFPFEYRASHEYRPPKNAPPYRHLDPDIRDLFHRCFVEGYAENQRHRRPAAADWADMLRRSIPFPAAQFPRNTAGPTVSASMPMPLAVRTPWDELKHAALSVSRRGLIATLGFVLVLLVVGVLFHRAVTQNRRHPTINRLQSTPDSIFDTMYFKPGDPPLDSLLSRLRNQSHQQKDKQK